MSKTAAEIASSKARAARFREMHSNAKPDFSTLILDNPDYYTNLGNCLNWLGTEYNHQNLKDLVIVWAEENGHDHESLIKVPEFKFSSFGKSVYILSNGGQLDLHMQAKMTATLKTLLVEGKKLAEKETIREKYKRFVPNPGVVLADEVQDMIIMREADDQNLSELIFDSKLSQQDVAEFANRIKSFLSDWESDEPQCVEMHERMGVDRVAYNREKYHVTLKIVGMLLENIKAERKTSKKSKTFSEHRAERAVKNLKTKKVDMTYNIISLPPEEIVGSKVLLTFNTKTRRLGYYVATEGATLTVKGTTIQNYDEVKSFAKIVRNTDRDLAPFRNAKNERRIEVLITENIKGVKHELNGRLNVDTVILKAFRDK